MLAMLKLKYKKRSSIFIIVTFLTAIVLLLIYAAFWKINVSYIQPDSIQQLAKTRSLEGGLIPSSRQNKHDGNKIPQHIMGANHQVPVEKLFITGIIKPSKISTILSPFDGVIKEVKVNVGSFVDIEQPLLILDTSKIDESLREAQSAYIKAKIAVDKLKEWENGTEMQRASRSVNDADRELKKAQREEIEAKGLFDKGIIPRNEYENAVEQTKSRESSFHSAQNELRSAQNQGGEDALKMAILELQNATSRFESIQSDRKLNVVKSDLAGIVTLPPATGADNKSKIVEAGVSVLKGDALYNVADISRFIAEGQVDEIDINKVKLKQDVIIESDALPGISLKGNIINISAEATASDSMNRIPKYAVIASFDYDTRSKELIKIGMSARMTIIVSEAKLGQLVPIAAIIDIENDPKLRVMRDGKIQLIDVKLGKTSIEGIEILDGLLESDKLAGIDD